MKHSTIAATENIIKIYQQRQGKAVIALMLNLWYVCQQCNSAGFEKLYPITTASGDSGFFFFFFSLLLCSQFTET